MSALPSSMILTAADAAELAALSPAERDAVLAWLKDMELIAAAEHGRRGPVIASIARRRGYESPNTVRVKFDAWQREGWRGLINRRSFRGKSLPRGFVQYWLGLFESHNRRVTGLQAWRTLVARLEAWEREGGTEDSQYAIPGYATAPRRIHSNHRLPAGWHRATLLKVAKREGEKRARQIGSKDFSTTMPSVRSTRVGLEPGEFYGLDDEEVDVWTLCPWVGNNAPTRPLAFHCIDYASACNIARGYKPTIINADGTRQKLRQVDFDWFLLHVLTNIGYNPRKGTVLFGEMGTARASEHFRQALDDYFKGRIKWENSGHIGHAMRGMVYEGAVSGNFRAKRIEGWFNIERNYMAALPGPTGRNREEKPEETNAVVKAGEAFLELLDRLPLERRLLLRAPYLEWGSFTSVGNQVCELINRRTAHQLGQWIQCGYIVPTIIDSLPAELQARMLTDAAFRDAMMIAGAGKTRLMSPREVWDRDARLTKLRPWEAVLLMNPEQARPVKVNKTREISITDRDIDPDDELNFLCTQITNEKGDLVRVFPGDEFLAFLNPYAAQELILCRIEGSKRGAYLGTVPINPRVGLRDAEAAMSQYGKIKGVMQPTMDDIAARARPESRRRLAVKAINKRVADPSPLTPEEKTADEARRKMQALFDPDPAGMGMAAAEEEEGPAFVNPFAVD